MPIESNQILCHAGDDCEYIVDRSCCMHLCRSLDTQATEIAMNVMDQYIASI